jgi:hypothetical protein
MKPHHTSLVIVLILGSVSLALLGAWIFLGYEAKVFRDEIAVMSNEAKNRTALNTYLASIKSALRDAKTDLEVIDQRFIKRDKVSQFISLLEEKAAEASVLADVGSLTIETPENSRPILHLKISGSGAWENIVGFVSVLDTLPYVSRISGLTIAKKPLSAAQKDSEAPVEEYPWRFSIELSQSIEKE